jgi:predicted acetyltransferase
LFNGDKTLPQAGREKERAVWVRHFFICREHRRKGYGREAANLPFGALGTGEIGLSCLTKNEAGQAFWQSFDHEAPSIKYYIRKGEKERVHDALYR